MAERKRVHVKRTGLACEKASIVITSQHATSCLSFICFYQCEYRVISTEMRGVTFSRYFSNQSLASVARRRRRRGVCLWRVSLSCGRHGRTKKPKTAQVMSKANVYLYSYNNSPNTGLYAPLGFARALFLSSSLVCRCATLGCIMLRPVKKKKKLKRFLWKTLHALIKFHPNVYMMCTSSMFTNWPQEVLLLDTLEQRFLSRPHPPLNPYPYRSRFEFGIALDAPEGGVAFSYDAAQVFARERNWAESEW